MPCTLFHLTQLKLIVLNFSGGSWTTALAVIGNYLEIFESQISFW